MTVEAFLNISILSLISVYHNVFKKALKNVTKKAQKKPSKKHDFKIFIRIK